MNPDSTLTPNATSLFRGTTLSKKSRGLNVFDGIPPWRFYSFGWKWAVDVLLKEANTGLCTADCYYPVLYVFRQYLEIKLKELIIELELYLNSKKIDLKELKKFGGKKGHEIKPLWDNCESLLIKFSSGAESEPEDSECHTENLTNFKKIGRVISEIYEKDPYSFAYRYPPYAEKDAEKYTVDMNHFSENALWVINYLEGVSDWIDTIENLRNESADFYDES